MLAECPYHLLHPGSGLDVSDKGDEVARVGIEEIEGEGIMLGARLVGIIAEHLKRDHPDDLFTALMAQPRILVAAHVFPCLTAILFVGEGDEANGALDRKSVV